MKFLKQLGFFIAGLLGITIIVLIILYFVRGIEHTDLDEKAREDATGQFVDLTDGSTHFQLAGHDSGNVVVLVHGYSVPFYIWDGTFEKLSENGFRVLRYDMYGRGYSDRPEIVYNRKLYERQLLDILEALNLKAPVSLVGLSMGGAVAVGFAVHNPDKVRKLVLVDPLYFRVESPTMPEFVSSFLTRTMYAHDMADNQMTDFHNPELFPDWADRYREQMKYKGFQNALVSTDYHYLPDDHLKNYKLLNKMNKSVLLVWGKEDQTLPFVGSQTVRNTLKVEFLPVNEAGHLPHLEKAKEVNARIIEFLAR